MLDVTIKPEELYFLGEMMQAKYINYDYIAAMPDIGQRYAAEKATAIRDLGRRGLVTETLRGGVQVEGSLQKLLRPVFFAAIEKTLRILTLKPEQSVEILRFHILDGCITMTQTVHSQIKLTSVTEADLPAILRRKLASRRKNSIRIEENTATDRVIRVSSSRVGAGTQHNTYLLQTGIFYGADAADNPVRIEEDEMIEQILSVLKEA